MSTSTKAPSDPSSYTGQLCTWLADLELSSVPEHIQERAKYLILDGIACGFVGAHLPWSEKAVKAVLAMESPGSSTVIGWGKESKVGPLAASILNSTFIQGFELDDWHSKAPLHSNAIIQPALLAAAELKASKESRVFSGKDFLLAAIIGYEVGPRVGLALYGREILTQGWHSGAVFGPSASAAAVGKMIGLSPAAFEDALGIACTQACGLMSAQYGSDAKRMQHGFAARNGLFAALLAEVNYSGIKNVYECEYGGFLDMFTKGNGQTPQFKVKELTGDLGVKWQTEEVNLKPYASMAATHGTIDCVQTLQELYPEKLTAQKLKNIKSIEIGLDEAMFSHGGWKAKRPLTTLGGQMCTAYVAATQLVDGAVAPAQFRPQSLERDAVWELTDKTTCRHDKSFPSGKSQVSIIFDDGMTLTHAVPSQKGVDPPLSNDDVVQKWRLITRDVISEERRSDIENLILNLESVDDVTELSRLLEGKCSSPVA